MLISRCGLAKPADHTASLSPPRGTDGGVGGRGRNLDKDFEFLTGHRCSVLQHWDPVVHVHLAVLPDMRSERRVESPAVVLLWQTTQIFVSALGCAGFFPRSGYPGTNCGDDLSAMWCWPLQSVLEPVRQTVGHFTKGRKTTQLKELSPNWSCLLNVGCCRRRSVPSG